jgi:cytochrome c oxidase assembly protein subunit 15
VLLLIALLTYATLLRMHAAKDRLLLPTFIFFAAVVGLAAGILLQALIALNLFTVALIALSAAVMIFTAFNIIVTARAVELGGLVAPAFLLGLGIIAQAVVGGITVLTGLNSWIVGIHFVISIGLIAIAAILVWRALPKPSGEIASLNKFLAWPTVVVSLITILFGMVVAGAGPHAGDIDTPRNGLDLEIWQHYHSWPGYLMLGLITLQFLSQWLVSRKLWNDLATRILLVTLVFSILQAIVGILQARMGVPALLVGIHMFGAASLSALVTFQLLSARKINR